MMSAEEIKELKKGIAITASYYGRDLLPEAIQFMADDLADLPFEKVSQAYLKYRRDPKNRTMPLPAQIRAIADPVLTAEVESRDVIEKIKIAISKFGYMRGAEARAFVGEIGWRIVQGLGGWQRVCESNFIHNSALIAQARSRGEDLINFQGQIISDNLLAYEPDEQEQIGYEGV